MRKLKHSDFPANASTPVEIRQAANTAGLELIEQKGFMWSLAPTGSDSRLVTISKSVEKWLGLHRWRNQSPWLLYAARRRLARVSLALFCLIKMDSLMPLAEVWA